MPAGCSLDEGAGREKRIFLLFPLPLSAGEEGPKPKAWEVRVLLIPAYRPSPPKLRLGPSSPAESGRGTGGAPVATD